MTNVIRNCEFRFKCPKQWASLEATQNEKERFCSQCQRLVYHCKTPEELQLAINKNRCVAVQLVDYPPVSYGIGRSETPTMMVGEPRPKTDNKPPPGYQTTPPTQPPEPASPDKIKDAQG